jgi:hypothetical protein
VSNCAVAFVQKSVSAHGEAHFGAGEAFSTGHIKATRCKPDDHEDAFAGVMITVG